MEDAARAEARAELVVHDGGRELERVELRAERAQWVIGRSPENELCVEHPSVSRKHCAISRAEDGCYFVQDMGSVHGTLYGGQLLAPNSPMRLFDGVTLTLGECTHVYSTRGVPLVPARRPAQSAQPDSDATARMIGPMRAPPQGEAAVGDDALELFGLPLSFGKASVEAKSQSEQHSTLLRGGGGPEAAGGDGAAAGKRASKAKRNKIQVGAKLGASLGVLASSQPHDDAEGEQGTVGSRGRPPGHAADPRAAAALDAVAGAREPDGDEEAPIGPPMPASLAATASASLTVTARAGVGAGAGAGAGAEAEVEADDEVEIGPPLPPGGLGGADGGSGAESEPDDDDDDDEEEEDGEEAQAERASLDRFRLRLPTSHSVRIAGHSKTVTVISLDHVGARMITGSSDYSMRLYDFNGMSASLQPFRSLEDPLGSYQLRSIDWSPTSSNFVVGASSPQPKLFDRDGKELSVLMRGDMYLRDLTHTRGHVSAVTCVRWNPAEALVIATSGEDSTLRTWDVEAVANRDDKTSLNPKSGQTRVLAVKDARGQRVPVSTFDWHYDGKLIALAAEDGTLQLWDTRHHDTKAQLVATGAHQAGTTTTCVKFAPASSGSTAGHVLASRGGPGDGTLCIWDLRMVRAAAAAVLGGSRTAAAVPVASWAGLCTTNTSVPCVWSSNGQLLLTGTSVERGGDDSEATLLAFSTRSPEQPPIRESLGAGARLSISALAWHPRLNQIFVGASDGSTTGFYQTGMSERGLLFCAAKAVKRREVEMGDVAALEAANIITPHALPMFKEGVQRSKKRGREREREREVERNQPMRPPPGVGSGGRVTEGFQHALIKTVDKNLNAFRDEDPREALLRFAELAEKDPLWTKVYKATQPKAILAKTVDPADDDKDMLPP